MISFSHLVSDCENTIWSCVALHQGRGIHSTFNSNIWKRGPIRLGWIFFSLGVFQGVADAKGCTGSPWRALMVSTQTPTRARGPQLELHYWTTGLRVEVSSSGGLFWQIGPHCSVWGSFLVIKASLRQNIEPRGHRVTVGPLLSCVSKWWHCRGGQRTTQSMSQMLEISACSDGPHTYTLSCIICVHGHTEGGSEMWAWISECIFLRTGRRRCCQWWYL